MNKSLQPLLLLLLLLGGGTVLMAGEVLERYALIVGSDSGGPGTARLKYAASDAQHVQDILMRMGGLKPENNLLLVNPERDSLLQGLTFLQSKIRKNRTTDRQSQVVFYYSGHSDALGLQLGRERLDYSELKSKIASLQADVEIVVLDSCSSGAFTRSKGGQIQSPFLQDLSTDVEGHAYLTSSTAEEVSQESDKIQSSYFTHALLEGLRGAADSNGDGRVSLGELYDYAYGQTLTDTQKTTSGAQHPAFDIQLSGKGNLILTELRGSGATLVFPKSLRGRLTIRDIANRMVVELEKTADKELAIGVDEGFYRVGLLQDGKFFETTRLVDEPQAFAFDMEDFQKSTIEVTRARGGSNSGVFLNGAGIRVVAEDSTEPLVVNLLVGAASHLDGTMLSLVANTTKEGSSGWQGALGVNVAGDQFSGVQTALVNWVSGDMLGFQFGYLGNYSSGSVAGIQLGAVNVTAKDLGLAQVGLVNTVGGQGKYLQLGALNSSLSEFSGLQIGFVNIANDMTGVQFGLLNFSRSLKGLPLGLIDIQMNGQNHLDTVIGVTGTNWQTMDRDLMSTTSLRLGSEFLYKFVSFSTRLAYVGLNDVLPSTVLGAGMGLRIPLGLSGYAIHLDGGVCLDIDQISAAKPDPRLFPEFFPNVRTFASFTTAGGFGLIAGWDHPIYTQYYHTNFSTAGKLEFETPIGNFFMGNRFFAGLQF